MNPWDRAEGNGCAAVTLQGEPRSRTGEWARIAESRRASEDESPLILLIDDDFGTRETVQLALRREGFRVSTASSGAEGIALAASSSVALLIIDLRLPDMLGTELVRTIRSDGLSPPFVLMSGYLTIPVAVEAMKLGAVHVLEKPVDIDDVVAVVRLGLASRALPRAAARPVWSDLAPPPMVATYAPRRLAARPGSAAERWAALVIKACDSEVDLKTLRDWASFAGVSLSSLCESCRLLGIRPHEARDLARVLRAVNKARLHNCHFEMLLDVSDRRTLRTLLDRAGLRSGQPTDSVTVEQFLRCQRFVSHNNDGLRLLWGLLVGGAHPF